MARLWRSALLVLVALLLAALGFLAWQRFWPAQAAPGWRYAVAHADIAKASALAWQGDALLTAEELKDGKGRLLRYDAADGSLTVLRDHLDEAESFTRCPDGSAFYTEKSRGLVRQLSEDGRDPPALSDLREPSFLLCDHRGLWISEDSTHRARLLLWDRQSAPRAILTFLRAPQALLPRGDGYLLAEGGRDRIIALDPR